jgi:ferredoxin-NADP reductase
MIAGGIGITPMLSMLRYMNDLDDPRRIILIWSNQTPEHAFGLSELWAMEKKLTAFRWIPIFTREKGDTGHFGRLDRKKLASLLQSYSRDAATFLCGPPPMIKQVRLDLLEIGFPKKSIHFEAFGL